MKYGTAIGNWGDVICALGFFQQKIGTGGIVYFGGIDGMEDFLKCQTFITDIRTTRHKDVVEFQTTMQALWTPELYEQGLLTILGNTGLTPDDIVNTALSFEESSHYNSDYPLARNLNLPQEAKDWAANVCVNIPRPFYLLQPYSINTVNRQAHWPHWWEYILWIIRDQEKTFVTIGKEWDDSPLETFNNIVRLTNQTPTMNHVFALAELADGVITTSNSLAHFCAAQNIKTIVCGNIRNTDPKDFFTKIIQGDDIKLFSYYSKLLKVCYASKEIFDIWPTH
jgi:hypothetical protein